MLRRCRYRLRYAAGEKNDPVRAGASSDLREGSSALSGGDKEILHGVNFDVERSETLVILGGSGSGKSTLLRTLVGLEKPSAGQIWMKGQDIAAISHAQMDEIRKKINACRSQGGALFGSMTVGENVALPLREHTKLEASTIEIMVRLKLDQVGLAGFEWTTCPRN